jgi:gamma-glutamyltranspeptidase/glutathione hydrolase
VLQPVPVRCAPTAAVAAADHLAAEAGAHILRLGGSAADAAVAANAVMGVTSPYLCGMGGDLFAVVHDASGGVHALVAAGRAGSGADADRLRAEGRVRMPFLDDIRVTPVPGCVDGWLALLHRFGRLPVATVLAPAIALADAGFPASPGLVEALPAVADRPWAADLRAATRPGAPVRRPGVARALRAIAADGRAGFYGGDFGAGLLRLGPEEFTPTDLAQDQAAWIPPLRIEAWGARLWTVPPPSSGYLVLAAAGVIEGLDLPADPDDPAWAHLLVEAARVVGHDRPASLHEHADGAAFLERTPLAARRALIDPATACDLPMPTAPGDTTYLCAVDGDRAGVSLIQSNAGGFGSGLGDPSTGIGLQNRGVGFSLEPGHPAEYGPGRRPPSTLAPVLLTRPGGGLLATLGTMGGDAQPQVVLQLLARLLAAGQAPGPALAAGRFALGPRVPGEAPGFSTWREGGKVAVEVEAQCPATWADGLAARGHTVRAAPAFSPRFGHAQAILVRPDGMLEAAADPRHPAGGAIGW